MIIATLLSFAALVALVASAFCSGTETAFLSVSRERILHLAREGGRKAQIIQRALSDMGRTTTTILIGNNISNVAYSSAIAALMARFDPSASVHTACNLLAAFAVLYFSEFTPKLICSARPLKSAMRLADSYRWMATALRPLTWVALKFTDLFVPRTTAKYRLTMDDLLRILQDRKDGVCVSDIESALISRLIVLRAKGRPITAESLMSAIREV